MNLSFGSKNVRGHDGQRVNMILMVRPHIQSFKGFALLLVLFGKSRTTPYEFWWNYKKAGPSPRTKPCFIKNEVILHLKITGKTYAMFYDACNIQQLHVQGGGSPAKQ